MAAFEGQDLKKAIDSLVNVYAEVEILQEWVNNVFLTKMPNWPIGQLGDQKLHQKRLEGMIGTFVSL